MRFIHLIGIKLLRKRIVLFASIVPAFQYQAVAFAHLFFLEGMGFVVNIGKNAVVINPI